MNCSARSRWPVEDTGMNSVIPSMKPRMIAASQSDIGVQKAKAGVARKSGDCCLRRVLRVLDGGLAALFGPDADGVFNREDEDLAVTNLASLGCADDGVDGLRH